MIEENIKKANITAMKNKDSVARGLYSILLNRILMEKISKGDRENPLEDAAVSVILQKLVKELAEEKENYAKVGNMHEVEILTKHIEIASAYLPQMLSEEEVKAEILALDDKSIPSVMKHFKANFAGKVDMRLVQEVLKGL